MKEIADFRIPETRAQGYLKPGEGIVLGGSVRKVVVPTDAPLFQRIGTLAREFGERNAVFFSSWSIRRQYSAAEAASAELWHLVVTAVFEPAGEECGTVYDASTACPACGAERIQRSELVLDLRKLPKGKDIARTIADEVVVSQRLAELVVDTGLTGVRLGAVRHRARFQDDAFRLEASRAGRLLIRQAAAEGIETGGWGFTVWLNRPEQAELLQRAVDETVDRRERKASQRKWEPPVWYQLFPTSPPVEIVPPTNFGIDPFDPDVDGQYRCPLGHVSGLNLLSELHVSRASMGNRDVAATRQLIGDRQGVLVPFPLLLISPRFRDLLEREGMKGYRTEVAHLR